MAREWELLAVSKGKIGQFYMELCDGDACRRVPIEPQQAAILLANLAAGKSIYAQDLDEETVSDVPDEGQP